MWLRKLAEYISFVMISMRNPSGLRDNNKLFLPVYRLLKTVNTVNSG
jgi:hypothetical protein